MCVCLFVCMCMLVYLCVCSDSATQVSIQNAHLKLNSDNPTATGKPRWFAGSNGNSMINQHRLNALILFWFLCCCCCCFILLLALLCVLYYYY